MLKKKTLGQHFLQSPAYLRAIVDAAGVVVGDTVLEVGPGEGALTRELLSREAKVIAIEKDHRLVPMLGATFDKEVYGGQLTVIEGDALEVDIETLTPSPYKVVANIPYYITGALLRKFLAAPHQPSTLVFLTQKEVAERITGHSSTRSGQAALKSKGMKESILSLSVKAFGTPTYVKTVPRGAFAPAPSVDSAILLVSNISRHNFKNTGQEKRFFALIHAGFGQKRKLLARNLEPVLGDTTPLYMEKAGIPPKARAEDVSLEKWLALAQMSLNIKP